MIQILDVVKPPRKTGSGAGRKKKYLFDELELGKSFFAEGTKLQSMANLATYWRNKSNKGRSFSCKECWKLNDEYLFEPNDNAVAGVMVWRVK